MGQESGREMNDFEPTPKEVRSLVTRPQHTHTHTRPSWLAFRTSSPLYSVPSVSRKTSFKSTPTSNVRPIKKVKLSLCLTKHHSMRTYWGSGGIAPCIL
jgi:hypothetical protein